MMFCKYILGYKETKVNSIAIDESIMTVLNQCQKTLGNLVKITRNKLRGAMDETESL